MMYIGIDPGAKGALALYDPLTNALQVFDMPTVLVEIGGKKRPRIDHLGLSYLLERIAPRVTAAAIESVHGMLGDTPVSAFAFGEAFGAAKQAVVSAGIQQLVKVTPQTWKAFYGLLGKDKNASRDRATLLFPDAAMQFKRVKDDGRAEAALIARYLAQTASKK